MEVLKLRCLSIGKCISLLYRYSQIYLTKELEPYGIGKGQFLFLFVLYKKDGLSQEELSQILNMDKGTTARAIDKLEKSGYVTKKSYEKDLRINHIFLTEKAKKFEPQLYSILKNWTDILSTGMEKDEVEKTFNSLAKMTENATKHIAKYR